LGGFKHSLNASSDDSRAVFVKCRTKTKYLIELAQISFSAFSDQSVGTKVVHKFLDDFAVGSNVMCVLIAFVSSSYFQVCGDKYSQHPEQ
jgi:hypothetical protein